MSVTERRSPEKAMTFVCGCSFIIWLSAPHIYIFLSSLLYDDWISSYFFFTSFHSFSCHSHRNFYPFNSLLACVHCTQYLSVSSCLFPSIILNFISFLYQTSIALAHTTVSGCKCNANSKSFTNLYAAEPLFMSVFLRAIAWMHVLYVYVIDCKSIKAKYHLNKIRSHSKHRVYNTK